jgi:acetyltransferase-like isoleucine patch superfamily enzyme
MEVKNKIHPKANVSSKDIGDGTTIWQFVTVASKVIIGENCNICDFCFIESNVTIGNRVTLKCGVYLWDGITVEDDVFIGPNVTFTNDKFPRSKGDFILDKTLLKKGCSLGANSTIIGGVIINEYALVGAGSVVTKDVPKNALIVGNPGRQVGWVDDIGNKLSVTSTGEYFSKETGIKYVEKDGELQVI